MADRLKCEICGIRIIGQGHLKRHYLTVHKDHMFIDELKKGINERIRKATEEDKGHTEGFSELV